MTDWRVWLYGVLSWLIPFVASVPFFDRTGTLVVPQPLFKSLIVVIGGGVGVLLIVATFRRVQPSWRTGLVVGLLWLVLNWALDLAVLVPMSGTGAGAWFIDIGLRYLMLPMIATGMAAVAGRGGSGQDL